MKNKTLSLGLLLLLLSSVLLLMATEPTPSFGQRPDEQDERDERDQQDKVGPYQVFLPLVEQDVDSLPPVPPAEPENDGEDGQGARPETPSRAPTAGAVTFAMLGDYGSLGRDPDRVARMIDTWSPDFVVTAGDNYYGSVGGAGGNGMNQLDNAVGTGGKLSTSCSTRGKKT